MAYSTHAARRCVIAHSCGNAKRSRDLGRVDAIAFNNPLDDGNSIALTQPALSVGPIFDHLAWRNSSRLHHVAIRSKQRADRVVVSPEIGNGLGLTMMIRFHRLVSFDQEPLRHLGQGFEHVPICEVLQRPGGVSPCSGPDSPRHLLLWILRQACCLAGLIAAPYPPR